MKKLIIILFSIVLLSACGVAKVENTTSVEKDLVSSDEVIDSTINLTGIWDGLLTHELVSGGCPPTPTQQGTVLIEQIGSAFTMQFSDGFDCSPSEACDFQGTVEGANYSATNGGIADSEGGTYTTTLTITAMSDESAQGIGGSIYSHPSMQCEWITSLSLTKRDTE